MTIEYAKQGVRRLIERRGTTVTYRSIRQPAPLDPTKEWIVGESRKVDVHGVPALFGPLETDSIAGTQIQSSDQQVLIPAECLGFEPAEGDEVIREGVHFGVVSLVNHKPGCEAYLYQLQIRPSPTPA